MYRMTSQLNGMQMKNRSAPALKLLNVVKEQPKDIKEV